MVGAKRKLIAGCAALAVAAALWALRVELTYESNVRRGIPAGFRLPNERRPLNWKV